MFIIFDLDDTLIDTSGSITPFQLKKALAYAVRKGVPIGDFELAYGRLMHSNLSALSGETALQTFLEQYIATEEVIKESLEVLHSMPDPDRPILPVAHAINVLKTLASHRLAIVTVGKDELQHFKLKKAGFDPTLFSKIIVTKEKNKKIHYASLLEEYGHCPEETIVVGDRISVDLEPAKQLGCRTVRLLRGRGSSEETVARVIDHTIHDLPELLEIVDNARMKTKA